MEMKKTAGTRHSRRTGRASRIVIVAVIEADQGIFPVGPQALQKVVGTDEPKAMVQVVLDERVELAHRGALERVHVVEGDLPLIAEQGVEQERQQPAPFSEQPQVGAGDQAIGGADHSLNGSDHREALLIQSMSLHRGSSSSFTTASPGAVPRSGCTPPASFP